jgi:hypothetical protein
MPVAAASIANLKPRAPFGSGNRIARRPASVDRACRLLRKAAPEAVQYCLRVLRDEEERTELRLRAAAAIIDKVVSSNDPRLTISADSIDCLKIVFVAPGEQTEPPVIDMDDDANR